jgi:hypothetical protein
MAPVGAVDAGVVLLKAVKVRGAEDGPKGGSPVETAKILRKY